MILHIRMLIIFLFLNYCNVQSGLGPYEQRKGSNNRSHRKHHFKPPVNHPVSSIQHITVPVGSQASASGAISNTTTNTSVVANPFLTIAQEINLINKTSGISFNLFSANVHLFPPIIHKMGSSYNDSSKNCGLNFQKDDPAMLPPVRAKTIGQKINNHANDFDVILLQEAWDKTSRNILYNQIKNAFPYKFEDDYQSALAYGGLDVILGSGLAVYSKYQLQPLIGRDGKTSDHILEVFVDYRGDECFANKGFIIVKIIKQGLPIYLATTHLQAGASDQDRYYMRGASRDSTRVVAQKEMKQIKAALAYVIMNDYYKKDLDDIIKKNKTDNSGISGFFNKYFWNTAKGITGKVNQLVTGSQSATTDEQKELQAVMNDIESFIEKTPNFWQQAYIFLAGDFNIGIKDDDYQDIKDIFGEKSLTIMQAAVIDSTSYKCLDTGEKKGEGYIIDHVLSLGAKPAAGGSYVSTLIDSKDSDHAGMDGLFKLKLLPSVISGN